MNGLKWRINLLFFELSVGRVVPGGGRRLMEHFSGVKRSPCPVRNGVSAAAVERWVWRREGGRGCGGLKEEETETLKRRR